MSAGRDAAPRTTPGWARRHVFTLVVTGLALASMALGAAIVDVEDVDDVVGIVAVPTVFWTILMQVRLRAWGRRAGATLGRRIAARRAAQESRPVDQG